MMTPRETVEALDKYIVGQEKAKKAVAIALRNRYRRSRLTEELRDEITPKNIIMVGPTGVGKTEIARRLAKLVDAPFIKVEATKFTEVGYVGRDVDSMIRDLVETSIRICKSKKQESVKLVAQAAAEERIIKILTDEENGESKDNDNMNNEMSPLHMLFGGAQKKSEPVLSEEEKLELKEKKKSVTERLRNGELEDKLISVEVETSATGGNDAFLAMGIDINVNEILGGVLPKKKKQRKVTIKEARRIFTQEESEKLIDMDEVIREAVEKTEQDGIIFIDEIDKIAGADRKNGPDVSREGVQRDILPIVEGSTVNTKYGPIRTDFILFIAAGAFHVSKVSDLIPELQGRFPIKVNLEPLSVEAYKSILVKPKNAITKQYAELLKTDNINLTFTDDALDAIAEHAYMANATSENIGARRLHTIVENLLEDISFNAGGNYPETDVKIDKDYVIEHLKGINDDDDLQKYII